MNENEITRAEVVEGLIDKVLAEIRKAHAARYDSKKAELSAALCLDAQFELAEFLAEAELLAKERKSNVESVEAEAYFGYKLGATGKTTDAGLKHLVAKDEKVIEAQKEQYIAEADYNKWKNLFGVLKDSHIYFRSIAKGNTEV